MGWTDGMDPDSDPDPDSSPTRTRTRTWTQTCPFFIAVMTLVIGVMSLFIGIMTLVRGLVLRLMASLIVRARQIVYTKGMWSELK